MILVIDDDGDRREVAVDEFIDLCFIDNREDIVYIEGVLGTLICILANKGVLTPFEFKVVMETDNTPIIDEVK